MTEEEKKEDAVDMIYGHIHSKYLAYSVSETSAFSISNLQNKIKENPGTPLILLKKMKAFTGTGLIN